MAKQEVKLLVESFRNFYKNKLLEAKVTFSPKAQQLISKADRVDIEDYLVNSIQPGIDKVVDINSQGAIKINNATLVTKSGPVMPNHLVRYLEAASRKQTQPTPTQQPQQNQIQPPANQQQPVPTQQTQQQSQQQQNTQQLQLSADENRLVGVVENLLATYRRNISLENSGLDNSVYSYLRDINDGSREIIMQMIGGQVGDKKFTQTPDDKKKLEQITKKYRSLKDKIAAHARSIGWEVAGDTEGEAWFQVTKTSSAPYQHGSGNFKTYVTFKKDPKKDLEGNFDGEFWNNLNKLIPLMDAINNSNIKPKNRIGFKIAGKFTAGYIDLDNLVIHYKDKNDEILVDNAIKQAGFSTQDRSQYGRMDKGRDVQGKDGKAKSDSQLVSEEVAKNLLAKKNEIEPYFKTYRFTRQHYQNLNTTNQPINEKEIKQGFAKVKQEIYSISRSASHRV